MKLQGKVILVTGASRGIGRLIAQELGKAGAKLALVARDQEGLQQACQSIGVDRTLPVAADLATL